MPKDDKRKELTQEEIDAQNEKFRTFFSTSVAQVPEEMKRRDEEKENTGSLLGKLFHREKDKEEPAAAPAVQNELPPTGEIVLGHEEEAEAGLELALEPGELEEAEPVALPTAPEAPAAPKPEPGPHPAREKAGAAPPPGTPDPAGAAGGCRDGRTQGHALWHPQARQVRPGGGGAGCPRRGAGRGAGSSRSA